MRDRSASRRNAPDASESSSNLGSALDAAITRATALENRIRFAGHTGGPRRSDRRLRNAWSECDSLARELAAARAHSLHDLRAKAVAFLWLDGGLIVEEASACSRLVRDVMVGLAGYGQPVIDPATWSSTTAPLLGRVEEPAARSATP